MYKRQGGWNLYFFEVMTGEQTIGFEPELYLRHRSDRDVKKRSLDEHKSQEPEEIWQAHEQMHRRRGAECGVEFAEAYKLVEAKEGCPRLPVKLLNEKEPGIRSGQARGGSVKSLGSRSDAVMSEPTTSTAARRRRSRFSLAHF